MKVIKKPSELELLGVQTAGDAELLRAAYPEWFLLSAEERGYPERLARHNAKSFFEMVLAFGFVAIVGITAFLMIVTK